MNDSQRASAPLISPDYYASSSAPVTPSNTGSYQQSPNYTPNTQQSITIAIQNVAALFYEYNTITLTNNLSRKCIRTDAYGTIDSLGLINELSSHWIVRAHNQHIRLQSKRYQNKFLRITTNKKNIDCNGDNLSIESLFNILALPDGQISLISVYAPHIKLNFNTNGIFQLQQYNGGELFHVQAVSTHVQAPSTVSIPIGVPNICIAGGAHVLETEFTFCGLCCAVFFFPLGVLFCLCNPSKRCIKCGTLIHKGC